MISKSEFMKVAQRVQDSYVDFVLGSYVEAKAEGILPQVYDFMKNNEGLSTDDVCEYIQFLEGDPKPVVIVESKHLQTA